MLFSVEQAFVGREEIRAPLKTPAWEATIDVAVLSCFNMKLQRWQALSVPSLYKHAVASSRSASFNSLDSVISEYETKATTRRTDRAV